ncbi:hypothetical protein AB0L85_18785 [Streptomyces sp. NPDC052051]|uniref:hypothetical protein n=1 Tax=Streptomyces sp. NPDC052051 TaxID=3154649 RepID=UPI003445AE1D
MDRTLVTRPPHTSADWWVTADQARHAAQGGLTGAATAPDLLRTLVELDHARRESTVAVGAAVEALLTGGVAWEAIAAALGLGSAEAAQDALAAARRDAGTALDRRRSRRR